MENFTARLSEDVLARERPKREGESQISLSRAKLLPFRSVLMNNLQCGREVIPTPLRSQRSPKQLGGVLDAGWNNSGVVFPPAVDR